MSGPCFVLYFESLESHALQACLSLIPGVVVQSDSFGLRAYLRGASIPRRLREPGTSERRDCEYTLRLGSSSLASSPRSIQETVRATLQALPSKMLECCASTKSRLEVDGLWWLEYRIVDGRRPPPARRLRPTPAPSEAGVQPARASPGGASLGSPRAVFQHIARHVMSAPFQELWAPAVGRSHSPMIATPEGAR
jgi:hypothetical protein